MQNEISCIKTNNNIVSFSKLLLMQAQALEETLQNSGKAKDSYHLLQEVDNFFKSYKCFPALRKRIKFTSKLIKNDEFLTDSHKEIINLLIYEIRTWAIFLCSEGSQN